MSIPRLTPPQRRLIAALEAPRPDGWARYKPVTRGGALLSAWALWRRGFVATSEHETPAAFERRKDGWLQLTPLGIQLREALLQRAGEGQPT